MKGKFKKGLLMSFLLSALCLASNAMAVGTVSVSNVSSTGDVFEATVIPDGNWAPESITFWAWYSTDYWGNTWGTWKVLSDTNRDSHLAENLGANRYRMAADNLGFLGNSIWGYFHEINSLDTIVRSQGFWIGYDDPETPGDYPFYMVLRDGNIYDENLAWTLGTQINPNSATYPDWAFAGNNGVPEPVTLLLMGIGLMGFKLKKKN
ncbi:MAG: PEP-CTERM sorting domain-containing protein [Candidatus Schekmanbacteria bacterium]|nr:PEP-CTERM sorting domain-containing protein [Candidatus Schekmanbacteria bacterium]